MSPWRSRPDAEAVIVDEIGPALLVRTARDPAVPLTAMTGALPPEPGRIAIVTAPSITIRSDYLQLVGQIIDDWLQGDDVGVRLIALGPAEVPSAFESRLRALSFDADREVVAPLGSLTIGADGTVAAAAPSGADGGWVTYAPGAPPHYEPAWFPRPAWAKDLPPRTARVSVYGAAATYPVPAGYWILPRDVTPGRAGAASTTAPDPTMARVFLGGFGDQPLALDDVVLSLAALPFPDRYRLVLLPGALRSREDTVHLREYCDPPAKITAAVPVWSGGGTWTLAFVAATGALTGQIPHGDRRTGFPPLPRGVQDSVPARQVLPAPGRRERRRVLTGTQTAAGWSFLTESEPVGVVPTPVGFVVEVDMDTTGFRMHGKSVAPGRLAELIAEVCPPGYRTVVVIAHDTPPSGQLADALFRVLASVLNRVVIAADSEVSMSRTGLLYTSGQFRSWRGLPAEPRTGPHVGPSAALGDTLPPLPPTAPALPGRSALTLRSAPPETMDTAAGPRWITEGSCDTSDRLRLQHVLDGQYEAHARIVVRQLLADQETLDARPTPATVTGLVAVRAYWTTERDTVNGDLRGAGPEPDGATSTLIAACAMFGLRHLPVVSGPVFATCPVPIPLTAYETGAELVEPAFVDVGLSPNLEPGDGVDYHIWSLSARRLGSFAPDGRNTAVFAAGSRFRVLGVEARAQRPRVMLLDLAAPGDPRQEMPDTGSWAEDIVEMLRHGHLPAGREAGPGPRPLAFPAGLDDSGRPYRHPDHSRDPAASSAIELLPDSVHIRRHRHVPPRAASDAVLRTAREKPPDAGSVPPIPPAQAKVRAGGIAVVSAVGVRAEVRIAAPARPWWLDPWTPEPAAVLPAVLGEDGRRRLFLDLATVPGVLAVTGELLLCRRYALGIAETMSGRGCHVTLVGGALDIAVPPGWHRRPDFPEIDTADAGTGIVITEDLGGAGLHLAHSLARRTGGRYIAVVIGEVPRSQWSVNVEGTAW